MNIIAQNIDFLFNFSFGLALALSLQKTNKKTTVRDVLRMAVFSFTASYWIGDVACEIPIIAESASRCWLARLALAGFGDKIWQIAGLLLEKIIENPLTIIEKFIPIKWKK